MKEKEQVNDKSCVSDLVKNSDLDIKLSDKKRIKSRGK